MIRNLNPAPLEGMFETDVTYIIPDVIIKFTPAGHEITLNDGWVASYSMSDYYVRMMQSTTDESVKNTFRQNTLVVAYYSIISNGAARHYII